MAFARKPVCLLPPPPVSCATVSTLQSVLYKMDSPDAMADAVALIDLNTEFPDGTTSIRAATPSEDGRYFAYGLSSGGTDWTVIKVRDVATGAILPGSCPHCWLGGA